MSINNPWPAGITPTHGGFYHINTDRSGGMSLGGGEQIVASPGSRWGAKMTFLIWNAERLRQMRALRALLKGRTNAVLLPNFDRLNLKIPTPAATFEAAYSAGATDITVIGSSDSVEPGHQFTYSGRLYEIENQYPLGGLHHVVIWPPLRAAVPAGGALNFLGAQCYMRCLNLDEQLQQLADLHFATLELEFEEYI